MDLTGISWHEASVALAAVLGPLGCLVSLGYAIRVDHRDSWRRPMLISAVVGGIAILAAYVTGEQALAAEGKLAQDFRVDDHREYALKLLLPTSAWLVIAVITGLVDPRTGALRVMLPLLLTGFSVIVLTLVILSGDDGARALWENVAGQVG